MISKQIDKWIEWTKWPVAILALLSVPVSLITIGGLVWKSLGSPIYLVMFLAGLGLIVFAARTDIVKFRLVRSLFRWLHDGTQAVVATLLLHPVVAIRSKSPTPEQSRVRWLGRGNWVLLAAPYTIPVTTLALWMASLILFAPLRSAVLGMGLGLHIAYVLHHWREGTSEMKRLGSRFCWMFFPAVQLGVAGLIFSFAVFGFVGVWDFLVDWITLPWNTWKMLWNGLFTPGLG